MFPSSSWRPGLSPGPDGILQSINLDAKVQDENMQSAFQDLEILMVRAGEMVRSTSDHRLNLPGLTELR